MLSRLAGLAARQLARSWRMEIVQPEHPAAVVATGRPFVLLCWHECLLPVMWQHREQGIAAVISQARDGEYLARFADSLGYRLIRGSSTRGGRRALAGAIRALRGGTSVGFTPDGPRGPRRVAKPGAFVAAVRGAALVLPVHVEARPAWRAGSWDRFLLPGPWARVRLAYGSPVDAAVHADPEDVAVRVVRELDDAMRRAAWHDGAAIPTD
ncbi:MAG: lysophospholipid acyltransferase family protein [Gemmatimonadetes bacterium]|nr:lysophospholipid acyltransferase family protein [Gemmatimonadota bacterium]MBP6669600.1 lysophospholipid acyltransferase family protein [Gemmatimonadales bacterium]MBK6778963.1 lysophospholipid acyltransferase family protein [Gemmatimonadota bacterium]MBK7348727.1 lysophospholipid acyltransferase family protein [Gemmatimonadota bacterium]MBK7714292.1 lysophospholipid acyltransferase family protein [Gemmatimonadota bacterium]